MIVRHLGQPMKTSFPAQDYYATMAILYILQVFLRKELTVIGELDTGNWRDECLGEG